MKVFLTKQNCIEGLFILICLAASFIISNYSGFITLILLLLVYFSRNYIKGEERIYSNKKLIIVFLMVYSILVINAILTTVGVYKHFSINPIHIKTILKVVCVILLLVTLKILNISIKDFNWGVKKSQIYVAVAIGIIFSAIIIGLDGFRFINDYNSNVAHYALYLIQIAILTAFLEELLCRGVLISALKGYELEDWKANLIQAVLFGIIHFVKYIDRGIVVALIITTSQTFAGYFFGKLYLQTKTLTPGIIVHFIWDII